MLRENLFYAAYSVIHGIGEKLEPLFYSPAEKKSADLLKRMRENEARNIGKAFTENLIPGLPAELSDFSKIFSLKAQDYHKDNLMRRLDVISAGSVGYSLAEYGLTPADFAKISHSAGKKLRLRIYYQNLPYDAKINFMPGSEAEDGSLTFTRQDMLRCVVETAEVPGPTVHQLTDWYLKVIPHRPYAVSGFQLEQNSERPHLLQLPRGQGLALPELKFVWGKRKEN